MKYCERKQRELLQCWRLAGGDYLVIVDGLPTEYTREHFDSVYQLTTATPAEPPPPIRTPIDEALDNLALKGVLVIDPSK